MGHDLPYFKFFPGEWLKGDITLCSLQAQGVFINICSYYWLKDGNMSLANAKQRFSTSLESLDELRSTGIISIKEDENINIEFLDEQISMFHDLSGKRAKAGRKGGIAKAMQLPKFAEAKVGNIEKIREDKKKEDNTIPPDKNDVIEYCKVRKNNVDANKWYDHYTANGWLIGKNKMKDWRAAIRTWEEKKEESQKPKLAI